ncbi:putative glucan 1, 4-alpha-glucosidase [Dichotomopilus funicola]|uniref:Glucan 1, 4-alpha-glucosidase n=1 Tax=Dichotomopilus funicola TaxID=1934379 RepID=A0AAN6ZK72_9PEZI|nr:putative glucan 1, 4-alpha-glucosidase [Dichotomopilus funicola]
MATSPQSPPKRPRLSLQIRAIANGPSMRTSRCVAAAVDVKSPTSFNTLSNVYATAVDRSTPLQEKPPTTAICGRRPMLRLQTQDATPKPTTANTPYLGPYLDTPVTAQAISPAVAKQVFFPSAMTATPPLSAQPIEQNGAQVFNFDGTTPATAFPPGTTLPGSAPAPVPVQTPAPSQAPSQIQPQMQNAKRRTTAPAGNMKLPYTHPRSLRSILRNSPLPPLSIKSPESPRRQSLRLQEKALRRVAYNSPLTQEITTSWYTKSHIDLLAEDATPISPSASSSDGGDSLDLAMADAASCDTTRDGGQTPGPFEEMRRRMANMQASTPTALSPTSGGIRKRGGKRREKKRRWVWTIGQDEDAEENGPAAAEQAEQVTAQKVAAPSLPAPSVPVLAMPAPRPRTRNQQAQLAKAVAAASDAQGQQAQPQVQVPRLSIPSPRARGAATSLPRGPNTQPPSSIGTPSQQQQPQQQPQQQQENTPHDRTQRELTPIPSSLLPTRASTPDSHPPSVRHLTPDPHHHHHAMDINNLHHHLDMSNTAMTEPPTPSMESTTSAESSSLHSNSTAGDGDADGDADVEMSDASSFTSVEEDSCDEGSLGRGGGKKATAALRFGLGLGLYAPDEDTEMDEGTPTMTARPVGTREGQGWVPWKDVVS